MFSGYYLSFWLLLKPDPQWLAKLIDTLSTKTISLFLKAYLIHVYLCVPVCLYVQQMHAGACRGPLGPWGWSSIELSPVGAEPSCSVRPLLGHLFSPHFCLFKRTLGASHGSVYLEAQHSGGRTLSLRPTWSTKWVSGLPGLHRESLKINKRLHFSSSWWVCLKKCGSHFALSFLGTVFGALSTPL